MVELVQCWLTYFCQKMLIGVLIIINLLRAAESGNHKTVELLIQRGIYPIPILEKILIIGVKYNHYKIIKLFNKPTIKLIYNIDYDTHI
jgi:hypothetical protein